MKPKEIKMISRLKSRKQRITASIACMFLALFSAGGLVFGFHCIERVDHRVTTEVIPDIATANSEKEMGGAIARLYANIAYLSRTNTNMMSLALTTGFMIAIAIINLADLTNRRLIVSMWERIQKLEDEIKEKKRQPNSDGEHGAASDAAARPE